MSINKKWVADPENQAKTTKLYRETSKTMQEIAAELQTTLHNVGAVLDQYIPPQERQRLASVRYHLSKVGSKNPMKGKTREQHHNWLGAVDDGYGYLTILHEGKRQFVHRIVMAQALGLAELPEDLAVHHIDGDKKNNNLDNLALVTKRGHRMIHTLQKTTTEELFLKRATIGEAMKYLTSQS
jgi:hypothetical protein